MSKFGTKEEIVKAIENHFVSMQTGKMTMSDLELLVEQARELYERVVVLRFKAYEENVFGDLSTEQVEAKEGLNHSEEVSNEQIVEQKVLSQDESFDLENKEETIEIQEEGEPVFDFSLFDEPAPSIIEPEAPQNEIIEEPTIHEYLEETETNTATENVAQSIEEPSFSQEEAHAVEFTNQINSFDESLRSEEAENIKEEVKIETAHFESDTEDPFHSILSTGDNSLATRLMQSRLDTLVGAFGFNEKFQCIQDLFKGSSDDFNQAIDVLDKMQSFEEAKEQLHYYVRLNNWNLESPITAEFVRKIERRFR